MTLNWIDTYTHIHSAEVSFYIRIIDEYTQCSEMVTIIDYNKHNVSEVFPGLHSDFNFDVVILLYQFRSNFGSICKLKPIMLSEIIYGVFENCLSM